LFGVLEFSYRFEDEDVVYLAGFGVGFWENITEVIIVDMTKKYVGMENKTLKEHHKRVGYVDRFLRWHLLLRCHFS
jgi:hypothetical protein